MDWRSHIVVACIGSLFIGVPIQLFHFKTSVSVEHNPPSLVRPGLKSGAHSLSRLKPTETFHIYPDLSLKSQVRPGLKSGAHSLSRLKPTETFYTYNILVLFRGLSLLAPDLSPGRVTTETFYTDNILVLFRGLSLLAPDLSPGRVWTTLSHSSQSMMNGELIRPALSQQLPHQLSTEQLRQLAQLITVKVLSGESWGSGILIHKQGQVYTVLTNQHVLAQGRANSYQIETSDGKIYRADLVRTVRFNGNDLGLITFRSSNKYAIASLGETSTPVVGDRVFASGFPFDSELPEPRGFVFTTGIISLFSDKAFAGGYQIGYTNQIEKGMSGGPLLDRQGKVVGINGIHAYPLWGNPYIFADGSEASVVMQEQMSQFSWAIPVQTFLQIAPPEAIAPPPILVNPQQQNIQPEPLW